MNEINEKTGKLNTVARTGGIKLEGEDKWINPSKEAKQNILDSLDKIRQYKGQTVRVKLEKEGTYKSIEVSEVEPNQTPKAEQVRNEGVDWDGKERRDFRSRAVAQLSQHLMIKYNGDLDKMLEDSERVISFIYKVR